MVNIGPLGDPPDGYEFEPDPYISLILCTCVRGCHHCRKQRTELVLARKRWDLNQVLTGDDWRWIEHHERLAAGLE